MFFSVSVHVSYECLCVGGCGCDLARCKIGAVEDCRYKLGQGKSTEEGNKLASIWGLKRSRTDLTDLAFYDIQ